MDLALTYSEISCPVEIPSEIVLKKHAILMLCIIKSAFCLDLLKWFIFCLVESYPNLEVTLKKTLPIPVTVASFKRSFGELQLFKNYLVKRNCQTCNLATESELSKEVGLKILFMSLLH